MSYMPNNKSAVSMNFGAPKTKRHGVFIEIWRDGQVGSSYASFDQSWGGGRGSYVDMRGRVFPEKVILRWRDLSGETQIRLRADEANYMKKAA